MIALLHAEFRRIHHDADVWSMYQTTQEALSNMLISDRSFAVIMIDLMAETERRQRVRRGIEPDRPGTPGNPRGDL